MYSDVDDVRDTGDIYQLNVDGQKDFRHGRDMAEIRTINDDDDVAARPSNDGDGCDLVSKPTAAPLSSRASAFSIAALMKDRDTDTSASSLSDERRQSDTDARHTAAGSLYEIAADQWQRQLRDYGASGDIVNAKADADYWATFNNTSQRRMYI